METVRRFVFPIIWMLVLGLIALALIKLAFFSGDATAQSSDGASPAANVDQYATVAVEKGNIDSTMDLAATVKPDEGTTLKAADAGEIDSISVKNGDHVSEGDRILQVRVPKDETPAAPADPAAPAAAPAKTSYRYLTLRATADGTIRDLDVIKGQTLAIGDPVATLSPGTYAIIADLTPEQQLQLTDIQITASAELPDSAEPVPCQAPMIEEDDPAVQPQQQAPSSEGADPAAGAPSAGSDSAASLRCPVPAGTKIVPGLAVDVTVDLGSADGVLTIPTTAVEGTGSAGKVYVLDEASGEPKPLEVTLGKRGTDAVEVTGGLEEGQEILQFVPGVDAENSGDAGMGGGW